MPITIGRGAECRREPGRVTVGPSDVAPTAESSPRVLRPRPGQGAGLEQFLVSSIACRSSMVIPSAT